MTKGVEPPIEPDLPIIDPHHHLWGSSMLPHYQPFPIELLAAERAASGHQIDATVFVNCHYSYLTDGPAEMRPIGETRAVEADALASESYGERGLVQAMVSYADMNLGGAIEPVLAAHLTESPSRFRGIRHITPSHPGFSMFGSNFPKEMLRMPAFREALGCLTRLGLTFDTYVLFPQLDDVAFLARAVPDATIILDHVGTPMQLPGFADDAEAYSVWRAGLAEIATCPNVVVKLGGLMMHHRSGDLSSEQAADAMRSHILTAIDLFTPQRCMFESNFPVDRVAISYGNLWNAFKRLTADFTREERETMFAHTAARTYSIIPRRRERRGPKGEQYASLGR